MPQVRLSLSRLWIIAANTFLEAVRQKLFHFLLLLAVGLMGSTQFLRDFNFGASELKFVTDFGLGAIVFFGSILTIATTAQLFFSEIENRTALTILAKPVLRTEFVVGKWLGVWLVTAVFCALVTVLLCVVLYWREGAILAVHPEAAEAGPLVRYGDVVLTGLVQWIKFGLLSAITLLIASFSNTNLFSVTMSFFVLVICHLQYLARDAWANVTFFPAKVGVGLLGLVFPNFQLFNLGDVVAAGRALEPTLVLRVSGYGLIYTAVFAALAIYSFRQREI